MAQRNDAIIDQLFSQSESESRCLVTQNEALRKALRRRIGKTVISPMPGLFARKTHWELLDKAQKHRELLRTLATKHPDWVFCSFSAACLLNLNVSWKHLDVIHVCSEFKPSAKPGKYIHRHRIRPVAEFIVDGIRITPPLQTITDCLVGTGFTDGMPIADSALSKLVMERGGLIESIEQKRHRKNERAILTALKTVEYADALAESGGESVARAIMIETGFQPDFLQFELSDPFDPNRTMRTDFAWERMATKLTLGELDGFVKYTDPEMLAGQTAAEKLVQERQRESHLSLYGHPLVRFTMRQVRAPGELLTLLQIAGIRQSPLPPWLSDINI